MLKALNDRIYVINYNPTEDQVIGLIKHIANRGVDGLAKEML